MFERRLYFHIDWLLLGAVLLIAGIGAAMIYSTTYVLLPDGTGYAGREFWTQLYAIGLGGIALLICLTIDYRIARRAFAADLRRAARPAGLRPGRRRQRRRRPALDRRSARSSSSRPSSAA